MNTRPPAPPADPLFRLFLRDVDWRRGTKRVALNTLNRWAAFLAARDATPIEAGRGDVEDFFDRGQASTTIAPQLRQLRAFYRWAIDAKLITRDPTAGKRIGKLPETAKGAVSDDEVAAMIHFCDPRSDVGRRDAAIISLLRRSGLRRGEVAALDLADYHDDVNNPTLKVGSLHRPTKTGEVRTVPVARETMRLIDRYVGLVRGDEPGPLFVSRGGADGRLTPGGVSLVIDRARRRAEIDRPVGVHEFRRAFAIDAKRKGVSDPALQRLAGWRDAAMIARYTRAADAELAHQEFRALMDPVTDNVRPIRRPRPGRRRPA